MFCVSRIFGKHVRTVVLLADRSDANAPVFGFINRMEMQLVPQEMFPCAISLTHSLPSSGVLLCILPELQ